jgi:hypothetical protein
MGLVGAALLSGCLVAGPVLTHSAAAAPCVETAGAEKAQRYVRECLEVSPATHPPCNAANVCSLIHDEIRRGCSILGRDAPAFCADYRRQGQSAPCPGLN